MAEWEKSTGLTVRIERMKKLSEHQEMVLQISWCVHVHMHAHVHM